MDYTIDTFDLFNINAVLVNEYEEYTLLKDFIDELRKKDITKVEVDVEDLDTFPEATDQDDIYTMYDAATFTVYYADGTEIVEIVYWKFTLQENFLDEYAGIVSIEIWDN